jgi:nucleotide-binding universal stress UspA family protein
MLKKILAPTDFSELSARGVRYACQLAKDVGAEVIIFNVVLLDETNTIDKQEIARHKKRLDEFIAEKIAGVAADLKIRNMVDAGQPYGAIVDCAENERIDLIVMSSHGRSGLSRMLIGSVTDKILRGAPCPVLVVPSDQKT